MQGMVSKLSSYASLIGVIGIIGGGFMAWGEFNNRIAQLELVIESNQREIQSLKANIEGNKIFKENKKDK